MTALIEKDGLRFAAISPQQSDVSIQVPDTYRPPPADPGFAWGRVAEIAGRRPDAVAVFDGSRRVTYAELVDQARRCAALVACHVEGTGTPVGLLLDNSVELIAAILGTLAAGQVYVPLDPAMPAVRLTRVLERSGSGLLITTDARMEAARIAADGRIPVASVEQLPGPLAEDGSRSVSPYAPARLVYTSGSTGEPKGVPRSHRDLTAITDSAISHYYLSSSDRVALLAPLSFGMANGILWGALLAGATLCLYDLRERGMGGLPGWMLEQHITYLSLVPSVLRALAAASPPGMVFADVRCLRLGGDRTVVSDFDLFRRHFTDRAVLVNTLGASEVGSISNFCANRDTPVGTVFPVGYPLKPDVVGVIDESGNEVGVGIVGEIVVRRSATLGYWKDPGRSDERFVALPEGGFRYHTGDLAIRREDGCLEFVGRKDLRVKIDGQAVEIGEVEDALLRCDGVDEAVVMAVNDRSGGQRLVGYVRGPFQPDQRAQIRDRLADQLPSYMIPATLMKLDVMPMTARGKVDRSALPAPAWAESVPESGETDRIETVRRALAALPGVRSAAAVESDGKLAAFYVPTHGGVRTGSVRRALLSRLPDEAVPERLVPVDEIPEDFSAALDGSSTLIPTKLYDEGIYDLAYRIGSFFEEVLGTTVDFDDSFFDLGGTSLQAMAVFAKIDAAYGVNLSPTTIVDASTPRALAEVVQGHSFGTRRSALVTLRPDGSLTPIFHVHGGRGHVLHLHGLTQYADSDRPMFGFEQPGLHGRARPLRSVEKMARAYEEDLRKERPHGPYALMGHSFGGMVALEMAQRLTSAGEEVSLLTIFDTKFSHVPRPSPEVPASNWRPFPRRVLGRLRRQLRHWAKRAELGVKLRLGRPIPYDQRTLYFYWLHVRAARKYRPAPFSGRVLVISEKGARAYHERVWGEIAPGNFEIVELPVKHDQLIEEPYIVDVMREVETRIDG